jgi:hypothetical protein
MRIELPELQQISLKLETLDNRIRVLEAKLEPTKQWYSLKEAAAMKSIPYGSICSRPALQPNRGQCDGVVSGRKRWKFSTILRWCEMTDDELLDES